MVMDATATTTKGAFTMSRARLPLGVVLEVVRGVGGGRPRAVQQVGRGGVSGGGGGRRGGGRCCSCRH